MCAFTYNSFMAIFFVFFLPVDADKYFRGILEDHDVVLQLLEEVVSNPEHIYFMCSYGALGVRVYRINKCMHTCMHNMHHRPLAHSYRIRRGAVCHHSRLFALVHECTHVLMYSCTHVLMHTYIHTHTSTCAYA